MLKLAELQHHKPLRDSGPELRRASAHHTLYYAFLSYSHRDREIAEWLHSELERFRIPNSLAGRLAEHGTIPSRLTPIFRDRHELAAAGDLGDEIREALVSSRFLIVLCSPEAARSRWTNAEIETFKRVRPDGCVLAAIVAGEPFASDLPGREHEECYPPALRHRYDRRGRPTGKRAEPLAADLRDAGDGRRMGFLKLVAGMLGVGLDELVQRETIRRQRRLGYLAAASLAGMIVTSTLAVTAIDARDEARDQRREAEGLIAYMLGDLKERLEPIGRLDALDGVGSRVLAYYQHQDPSSLADPGLVRRSSALSLMAQVAYQRGNLDQARALYAQALAGTAEALRRSPRDTSRLFDHAQNVFWIAEVARARGQPDEAVAAYGQYKRLAEQLVALEPDNLKWRMERLYGIENVGISLYNKRRFEEAARQFESALGPMRDLAAVDSTNLTYAKELATVVAWLADAERARGNLDRAIGLRQHQIALLNAARRRTNDVQLRQQLIPAHQGLGILLTMRGESERGVEELRAAVAEADRLIPIEPANSVWKGLAAGARLDLARALLSLRQRDEAARLTAAACAMMPEIGSGGMARARRTACFAMRARLALDRGASAQALAAAQRALASAQTMRSEDPIRDRYMTAGIYRLIGDARRDMGDLEGARAAWSKALAQLPEATPETPSEMDEHATILERLGRADEAGRMAAHLERIGYRHTT